jgi:hypothetical protein
VGDALADVEAAWDAVPPGPDPLRFADPEAMVALLGGAGLGSVSIERLHSIVEVADAGELIDGMLAGSVRASSVILAQPPAVRERLREAVAARAERHRVGGRLRLPAAVVLGSAAARPGR